jgi:hypothetical protein
VEHVGLEAEAGKGGDELVSPKGLEAGHEEGKEGVAVEDGQPSGVQRAER